MKRLKRPSGYQDVASLTPIYFSLMVTNLSKVDRKDSLSMGRGGRPTP